MLHKKYGNMHSVPESSQAEDVEGADGVDSQNLRKALQVVCNALAARNDKTVNAPGA